MINKNFTYVNYHKHDRRCNVATGADSCLSTQDYVDRVKELGHNSISSCNHGYPMSQFEVYDSCIKNNLHYVYAVEGYFVLDTDSKDRTNAHIIYIAKNNKGRRAINNLISKIAIDENGVYYNRPRSKFDEILKLNPEDVMITTACMFGIWKYNNYEELLLKLHNHFGDSLYLEYQAHNKPEQVEINKKIKKYSEKYGINTIIGCDTHVIYEKEKNERPNGIKNREAILRSRKTDDQEEGWFMDYPSSYEIFERFEKQGVLSDQEIYEALNNTNIMLGFNVSIDKNRKMPTLYPELTQEEINVKYRELVTELWRDKKFRVPESTWNKHYQELKEETSVILESKTADYFILNYEMIKLGNSKGGMITLTGRGSGVSWLSNWLLGFTELNRLLNPVTMYKERFLTLERARQNIPDIDFNLGNPEVYAEAQEELLGASHAKPMIALGRLQEKSAFKMLSRSEDIDPKISNQITKRIRDWEEKVKYNKIEDEDGNEINDPSIKIEDFVGEEYLDIYNRSKKYMKIVDNIKQSPCSYVLYTQGKIEEEISLIRIKGKQGKPDVICANIEGSVAEDYGYVKNDLLKVKVVPLIYKSWERAGFEMVDANTLYKICENDEKVWDIYAKGLTLGINQYEKSGTAEKAKEYKPRNIVESSLFIGAIRPGFRSNINKFLNREEFNYGVPVFDNLIQTKEMPYTYLLFQEFLMKAFNFAGIPLEKTVDVIKAISKKKLEKIEAEKEQFYNGFTSKIMESENRTREESIEIIDKIWKIVYDSGAYLFNSSHSVSTATDSLYSAYVKAHDPLAFYETMFRLEKDKDKMSLIKKEMVEFGIKLGELKFGKDNTNFMLDRENFSINQSLKSVKFMSESMAVSLRDCKKYNNFLDFIFNIKEVNINSRQLDILIKIGYFDQYAKTGKLLKFMKWYSILSKKTFNKLDIFPELEKYLTKDSVVCYNEVQKRVKNDKLTDDMKIISQTAKTSMVKYQEEYLKYKYCEVSKSGAQYKNINKDEILKLIWNDIPDVDISSIDKVKYELEYLGYINEIPDELIIAKVDMVSAKNRSAKLTSLRSGKSRWYRFKKHECSLPRKNDIINIERDYIQDGYRGRKDFYCEAYELLKKGD